MLSKSRIKLLRSLKLKKYRDSEGLFLMEGDKIVKEALDSNWVCEEVFALADWIDGVAPSKNLGARLTKVSEGDLNMVSNLKSPNKAVALMRQKTDERNLKRTSSLLLYLERIRNPQNLGAILRIADWYGVSHVLTSPDFG